MVIASRMRERCRHFAGARRDQEPGGERCVRRLELVAVVSCGRFLTEAILLSVLGGAVGVILGAWASGSLGSLLPRTSVPINFDFHFDWRVAMYSCGHRATFAGMVVGLWPALRSARANLGEVLHEGGRSDSAGVTRHRARSFLVALQVARFAHPVDRCRSFRAQPEPSRADVPRVRSEPRSVCRHRCSARPDFDRAGTERFNRQGTAGPSSGRCPECNR